MSGLCGGGDVLLSNRPAALAVASMASVAIGGCTMPLEVFSSVMRRVAHVTPQAWGNDAFAKLVGHGASVAGILPQLGVLAAVAAVLLGLAAWRLLCILLA